MLPEVTTVDAAAMVRSAVRWYGRMRHAEGLEQRMTDGIVVQSQYSASASACLRLLLDAGLSRLEYQRVVTWGSEYYQRGLAGTLLSEEE